MGRVNPFLRSYTNTKECPLSAYRPTTRLKECSCDQHNFIGHKLTEFFPWPADTSSCHHELGHRTLGESSTSFDTLLIDWKGITFLSEKARVIRTGLCWRIVVVLWRPSYRTARLERCASYQTEGTIWTSFYTCFLYLYPTTYYKPIFINDSTRSETVFHRRKVHIQLYTYCHFMVFDRCVQCTSESIVPDLSSILLLIQWKLALYHFNVSQILLTLILSYQIFL